jgi:hypothetical protein
VNTTRPWTLSKKKADTWSSKQLTNAVNANLVAQSVHHIIIKTTAPQLKHPTPISKPIANNALAQTTLQPQSQTLVTVAFLKPLIVSHPVELR